MASPQLVLALTQPPAHEGGAPGRCSVGLMLGLLEHGISVRAVAAHGSEYPPEAAARLPEPLRDRIEFVAIPPWAPSVRDQVNRLRRPIGRLADGEFPARVRALAAQADLLHLEQLETAWCADGTSPPSALHLHYRVQMDRRPPPPWRKDFRYFAERVRAERLVIRRRRHLVASSPLVADSLRREHPEAEVVVAPLCLDPQHYRAAAPLDPPVVGIIGTGWWPPTASAIRRLVTRTWPLIRARSPDARLLVAGRGTADLGLPPTPGVEVLGSVRSGAEFISSLSTLVYPLDRGSGMKVKVLEAIASGVPVVATGPGAEGVAESDGVVVRETDEHIANETSELLRDVGARRERGAAARASFLRHYAPAPATEPLVDLYRRMAQAG